jgi:hypothetical protein
VTEGERLLKVVVPFMVPFDGSIPSPDGKEGVI